MPPKVFVIRTRYPHWGRYSGIGQILRHLEATDLEVVDHHAFDGDDDFPIRSRLVRQPLRHVVQRRGMAWYQLSDLWAEFRALRKSLLYSFDVIHYLDGEHSAQYVPQMLRWFPHASTRTLANFHQPPEELGTLVRREVIERLDHVVLMSPDQRVFFEGVLPEERVSVIPHGVDVDFFRPRQGTRSPAKRERFECLCVGHYLRDFDAIGGVARALQDEREITFRIISARPTGLEGLPNVEVESGLTDLELLAAYQRADVLFLPLISCTANNALLEGIACGLPLVSTDLASVRFYAPGDEALLVADNRHDEFADILTSLRDAPDTRARMARAARQRAEELGWPAIARSYEALYRSLAGEGGKEPKPAPARERPKVSVVIPARDAAETLEATLTSLRRQRYGEWEAIVVDDASRDATAAIARRAARRDRRIRVLSSRRAAIGGLQRRRPMGTGLARNRGARAARYDWLVFLDADDELDERYLERMTGLVRAEPGVEVVFCGSKRVTPTGKESTDDFWPDASKMFETLSRRSAFPIHACMVRRARFEELGGFDSELRSCEDWDLWQRVARTGARFAGVREPLALYRVRPGSKSMSGVAMLAGGLRVLEQGRRPDPRVPNPHPDNADGLGDQLDSDRFYFACWCAGLEMGGGKDARPLLAALGLPSPELDPDGVAHNLFESAILPSGVAAEEWVELLPTIGEDLDAFLKRLEEVAVAPGVARRSRLALENLIIHQTGSEATGLIGRSYCITIDVTRPLPDLRFRRGVERLRCAVALDATPLGVVELPVFDGFVGSAVLADAIAAEYGWLLLGHFFRQSIYDDVRTETGPSGTSLWRGDVRLSDEGADTAIDGWAALHDRVGWVVFLQELWGRPDLSRAAFSELPRPEVLSWASTDPDSSARRSPTWKTINVGVALSDIPVSNGSFLVPMVGRSPVGFIIPPQHRTLEAAEIRSLITVLGGFELCTLAVREAVLGRPFAAEPGTLNRRLREATGAPGPIGSEGQRRLVAPDGICLANAETSPGSPFLRSAPGPGILLARRPSAFRVDAYSRRAHLPTAALDAVSEAARAGGEPVVRVGDTSDRPTFVAYDPGLLWIRDSHATPPTPAEDGRFDTERISASNIGGHSANFTDELPILRFDRVAPDPGRDKHAPPVAPSAFGAQLAFLREAGYRSVTIEEWLRAAADRGRLPGRGVMLTFDSASADFLAHAWPALQRSGFSAILFLSPDEVSDAKKKSGAPDPAGSMRLAWQDVRSLQSEGVDVQALGAGSRPLTGLTPEEAVASAARTRAVLQDRLRSRVYALAYPLGAVDRVTEHVVGACGYALGMADVPEHATVWHRPLAQPRIRITGRDSLGDFIAKLG